MFYFVPNLYLLNTGKLQVPGAPASALLALSRYRKSLLRVAYHSYLHSYGKLALSLRYQVWHGTASDSASSFLR